MDDDIMDDMEKKIIITENYVKINHPILKEICLVCEKKFEVGDEIILAPIQKPLKSVATVMSKPVHRNCYYVKD